MSIQQKIEIVLKQKFEKVLSENSLKPILEKIRRKIIQLIINRTNDGYDIFSKRFKPYSPRYDKANALKSAIRRGRPVTIFKGNTVTTSAGRTPMRLTGYLMGNISCELTKVSRRSGGLGNIVDTVTFKVIIPDKFDGQIKGLIENGYKFIGLATSGTYQDKEKAEIQKLLKELKLQRIKV